MRLGMVAMDTTVRLHGCRSAALLAAQREMCQAASTLSESRMIVCAATDSARCVNQYCASYASGAAHCASSARRAFWRSALLGDGISDDAGAHSSAYSRTAYGGTVGGTAGNAAALDADYGGRSRMDTLLADILVVADAARYSRRKLKGWARPRRAAVPYPFWPTSAFEEPVPKGIIGIIAPWNYPVQLALWPVVDAIAAGNRVAVKPSEHVPRTAALIAALLDEVLGGLEQ
jgi:hypothetical protein